MRETDFIGKNKEKWRNFEQTLREKDADPDQLSKLFIETTDDLSFSRTYYPNRSVRVYLNGLSQRVYQKIYNNRQRQKGAFLKFWTAEIPDALFFARRPLLISFLVFVLGTAIGIISTIYNPEFTNIILSDYYVEKTEGYIQNGNPMAVYAQEAPLNMFLRIAWNNIMVSFYCFIAGLIFEIGSVFIIFSNAVMFGTFMWFFVDKDLGSEALLAVMLHGTIELSMIIISGAAGLVLGSGLVTPRSFTRSQALIRSARHAMKIMIAVVAFLVLAAFIEGFMTRFSVAENEVAQVLLDLSRGILILLSAAVVLLYFVYYPWLRYKQGKTVPIAQQESLIEDEDQNIENQVLKVSEIANLTWKSFTKMLPQLSLWSTLVGASLMITLYIIQGEHFLDLFDAGSFMSGGLFEMLGDSFWFFDDINNFFAFRESLVLFALVFIALALVLMKSLSMATKANNLEVKFWIHLINGFITSALLCIPMFVFDPDGDAFGLNLLFTLPLIFWWPFVLSWMSFSSMRKVDMFSGLPAYFQLMKGLWGRLLGLFFNVGMVSWLGITIAGAPLFYLVFQILGSQIGGGVSWSGDVVYLLYGFILLSVCSLFLMPLVHAFSLFYFSALEINTAEGLIAKVRQVQFKRRAYGLEKEQ